MTLTESDQRRFLTKFRVGDECWEWTGTIGAAGYSYFWVGGSPGRHLRAHRVSYEFFVGPIPEGLTIDHLCRNRACVRPDHLEPVTQGENVLRGDTASSRNAAKTHCPQGHPYDGRNSKGGRICRRCNARRQRLRMERLKQQAQSSDGRFDATPN